MGFPDICGIGRGSAFKKDAAKAGKEISSNDALQDHLLKRKVLRQKVWKTPQNNTPFSSRLWEGCCRDNTVEVRPSSKQRKNCDRNQPSNKNNSLVKETRVLIEDEDFDGNKMINNYVRMRKIGGGSYCKVVLYRNKNDEKLYAMKVFRKSRLSKIRINQLETAMTDVLREASIMKKLYHPNVVKLIEVIDDPNSDHLFMVLEYMEKGWIFKGSGPSGGIGERVARAYFKDMLAGLKYLHDNNIMHGDIKPENLLLSGDGHVKICDFSASRMFEDGNDELHRSAGTPVFTAPECSEGSVYHGKIADIWALGVTLYCMVFGQFPFLGGTLRETFDKIVNSPLEMPDDVDEDLADLLHRLLCKDPKNRISLPEVKKHPWMMK